MPKSIVCVEGLIGAGKSTLIEALQHETKFKVILEPVAKFQKFESYNPLQIMYGNMSREAPIVQVYINQVLRKHWTEHLQNCKPGEILFSERSIYSSNLFSSTMKRLGYISAFHYDFLASQVQESIKSLHLPPFGADKVFFLDVPPAVCQERILGRGRAEEKQTCDLEYLNALHCVMREFIDQFSQCKGESNVRLSQSKHIPSLKQELLDFANGL